MEEAGAKAARISLRRVGAFFESLPFPTDSSGAYRPTPLATTELASGPPLLKGYYHHLNGWLEFIEKTRRRKEEKRSLPEGF